MLLGALHATLLGDMLAGKVVKQLKSSEIPGRGVMKAGKGTITAGQDFYCCFIL